MELSNHKSFTKFLNEKELFINVDSSPSGTTIATVDDNDMKGKQLISRLKTLAQSSSLETILNDALLASDIKGKSLLNDIIVRALSIVNKSIDTTDDNWITKLKEKFENPYNVKLANGTFFGLDDIEKHFGKSFYEYQSVWDSLGTFKPGRPALGPGEVILLLFTNISNANGNGDLSLFRTNIEVKGHAGALKPGESTKFKETTLSIGKNIQDYLSSNNLPLLSDDTLNYFNNSKAWGKKTAKIIAESFFNDLKKIMKSTKNDLKFLNDIIHLLLLTPATIPDDTAAKLKSMIDGKKFTEFGHFITLLDLLTYKSIEKFQYLMLTTIRPKNTNKNKTFYFIDVNDKSFMDLWHNTWDKFVFTRIRYNGNKTEIESVTKNW